MSRLSVTLGLLVLALVSAAGAAAEESRGNGPFRIEWTVSNPGVIGGRIYNDYHDGATAIRLLVQGLDPAGTVVSTTYAWIGGELGPLDTRSFRLTRLPPSDHYLVKVDSYTIQQRAGCCPIH